MFVRHKFCKAKVTFMKAIFSFVNCFTCFFYRQQRMDIVVHKKMVFFALTDFGNSIALSSAERFSTKIAQNGEQVAPKINLMNCFA